MHPYTDIAEGSSWVVREFKQDIDPIELMWHRDDEDRELELIEGSNWKIQLEDSLPIDLTKSTRINIKKHEWHRLIKGSDSLIVKIHKF